MRTRFLHRAVSQLGWAEVIALAPHTVDHIHGVIRLEGDDYNHIIHLSSEGEPMGPQTLMKESWEPCDFDSLSLDSE